MQVVGFRKKKTEKKARGMRQNYTNIFKDCNSNDTLKPLKINSMKNSK